MHVVAQTNAVAGGVHPDPYTPSRGAAAPSTSDVPGGCGGGCEPIEKSSGHRDRGFAQDRHEGGTAEGMARRSRRESPAAHCGERSGKEHFFCFLKISLVLYNAVFRLLTIAQRVPTCGVNAVVLKSSEPAEHLPLASNSAKTAVLVEELGNPFRKKNNRNLAGTV